MKLSIITINYNNLDGLRKTMESVFAQRPLSPSPSPHSGKGDVDFEYIVIDGASTDGSAEYIKEHADKLTYWVSEKDAGIYNAMNKGVRAAKGEYLLMLNSGDFLVDEYVLERIIPELDGTDIVQGNTISFTQEGRLRKRGYGRSNISFVDAVEANFLHQASFIRRDLHDRYGFYEEEYKKSADSYFYITCLAFGNASFRYVDLDIANFDMNGISSNHDKKWIIIGQNEDNDWFEKHYLTGRLLELKRIELSRQSYYETMDKHPWTKKLFKRILTLVRYFDKPDRYVKIEFID